MRGLQCRAGFVIVGAMGIVSTGLMDHRISRSGLFTRQILTPLQTPFWDRFSRA